MPINCGVWRYHPIAEDVRGRRPRHDESVGPRLRRLRRDVHHQLRDRAPLARRPRRALRADVRPGPQPARLRADGQLRRPHALGRRRLADLARRRRGARRRRRRPRPRRRDDLPRRQLAGRVPQQLFTCNIHGNRVNRDRLERHGGGYVARHEPDFLLANDPWFRGLALRYGPDGGVYVSDWCDTGECHDYEDIHRENGRIYKITYGKPKPVSVRPGEARAMRSWWLCSRTRTTGTCGTPGDCCRSAFMPGSCSQKLIRR